MHHLLHNSQLNRMKTDIQFTQKKKKTFLGSEL